MPDEADEKLFAPEGSAEGCASGECLPDGTPAGAPSTVTINAAAPGTTSSNPTTPAAPPPSSVIQGSSTVRTTSPSAPPPGSTTQGTSTVRTTSPGAPPPSSSPQGTSPVRATSPSAIAQGPPPSPAPTAPSASQLDQWKAAVEAVRAASPRHGKSLSHGRFVDMEPGTVRMAFPADAAFHRTTVFGMSRQLIEDELSKHFGRPTRVAEDNTAQALKGAAPSIAEDEAKETAARHSAIDARVSHHPAIRSVLRILGGTVEHVQYLEPVREAPTLLPTAPSGADDE
ncbi:MAG: hypothetical protein IAE78_22505 [Myxococcus sp.]|nr:hypothetical protein [Myxococcus sp.]